MEQINTYEKGPIPPQDQALQISKQNTTLINNIRAPHKKERAFLLLLRSPSEVLQKMMCCLIVTCPVGETIQTNWNVN